jgi:hypothetical protein
MMMKEAREEACFYVLSRWGAGRGKDAKMASLS